MAKMDGMPFQCIPASPAATRKAMLSHARVIGIVKFPQNVEGVCGLIRIFMRINGLVGYLDNLGPMWHSLVHHDLPLQWQLFNSI